MKYYINAVFFTLLTFPVFSQSIDQIKTDRSYIWGEETGTTLKAADNEALSFLIGQISTQVESSFELLKSELTKNSESKITEKVNSVVKSYSDATLKNTRRIVVSNEPDAKVFRYIKRAELNKIFIQRKNKILELTEYGEKAEKELNYSIFNQGNLPRMLLLKDLMAHLEEIYNTYIFESIAQSREITEQWLYD